MHLYVYMLNSCVWDAQWHYIDVVFVSKVYFDSDLVKCKKNDRKYIAQNGITHVLYIHEV